MAKVALEYGYEYTAPIALQNWRIYNGYNLDGAEITEIHIDQGGFHLEIPVGHFDDTTGAATFFPGTEIRWNELASKKPNSSDTPNFERLLGFNPKKLTNPITLVLGEMDPEAKKQALTSLETSRALKYVIHRTAQQAYDIIAEKLYIPVA